MYHLRQWWAKEPQRQRSSYYKLRWSFYQVCSLPTKQRNSQVSVWRQKQWNLWIYFHRLVLYIETFQTTPSRKRSNWRKSTAILSSCWACETGPRTMLYNPNVIVWNSVKTTNINGNNGWYKYKFHGNFVRIKATTNE